MLIGEYNNSGALIREYIHVNGEPLAQIDKPGGTESILNLHTDHLLTARYATNAGGSTVWSWDSGAFGKEAPTGSATVNLRFPGQYFDAETGLHYNWHRYYDPTTGRYITSDPLGLAAGLNTYGYAAQNPLSTIDRDGLEFAINPRDLGINGIFIQILLNEIARIADVYSNWWNGTGGVTDEEAACETLWIVGPGLVGGVIKLIGTGARWVRNARGAGEVLEEAADNVAAYEKYKKQLRRNMPKPQAKDPKLQETIDKNYRENATVGSGSTADAVRGSSNRSACGRCMAYTES